MEGGCIEPAFVVGQCLLDVGPVENFIGCRIVIFFETALNCDFLRWCQELGCGRVVCDKPVGGDSDDDCEDSLENEDPLPTIKTCNASHVSDGPCKYTAESAGKRSC